MQETIHRFWAVHNTTHGINAIQRKRRREKKIYNTRSNSMHKHLQYVLLISSTKNQTKTKEVTKDGDFNVCECVLCTLC